MSASIETCFQSRFSSRRSGCGVDPGTRVEPELVMGGDREWGLGVALDSDGYGMGGLGGSSGWWSEAGQYAAAFLTGHIGDYDRGHRLESVVRDTLGLRRCNSLRR